MASELTAAKEANAQLLVEVARLKKAAKSNKRAIAAVKEAAEASRLAQERAEKKLRAAKDKAKELTTTVARREELFAQKGTRTAPLFPPLLSPRASLLSQPPSAGWRPSSQL